MKIIERLANPFVIMHTGIALGMILIAAIVCDITHGHRPERLALQNGFRPAPLPLKAKTPNKGGCLR
ncbi:MAG: hypothetical protein ACP5QG_09145 [candidate division WOR-3 bacterium]